MNEEIDKFIRDVTKNDCSGVFLSQNTGIVGKENFQIDIHNKNILIYIHCVNYDITKINLAINTIDVLYDKLINIYQELAFQYRVNWCRNEETKTKCYLPFDFALEDKKIIIELDGKQHFKQVRDWAAPEDTRKRDKYKMKKANENGFSVIRLIQLDVLIDSYDWLKELQENINIIQNI